MSKRAEMKAKRLREQRRNRILTLVIIIGTALVIVWLLVWPIIQPAGDFEIPDPKTRPMVDGRAMGNPDSPIVIEVFEDFQCQGCNFFSETVAMQIAQSYVAEGQVYYIFRHLPFLDDRARGSESDNAANASMCAAEQDAFWEYHDILFANFSAGNSGGYRIKRLYAFAEAIGLDMEAFEECFQSKRSMDLIEADTQKAEQLEVVFTPSVFINEQMVTPNAVPTFEQISQVIDELLQASEE